MDQTNDADELSPWIGRTEVVTDVVSPQSVDHLAKTLDCETGLNTGDRLPPLWHFCYFIESDGLSHLGPDGHSLKGGFLPPIALPRRMWASGRFTFHKDLHVGDEVERTATVKGIDHKSGASGPLIFVTVDYEYVVRGATVLTEEKDLVYRANPEPNAPAPKTRPAPEGGQWQTAVTPTSVMLFRYSAVTFNSHRIHYDRDYARDVEGYAGLVVHGPLTATLLAALAEQRRSQRLRTFSFRASAPLFDQPFSIDGKESPDGADLWAATPNGNLAMTASATF